MERNGRAPWPKGLSEQLRQVDRLRRAGRVAEALTAVRALAAAHPEQARVQLELGLTLGVWGGAPAEAVPVFTRALALAPGLLSARLHRALALSQLGRHAEAVADFDALEAAHLRNRLVLHMKRAESHEALGRWEAAEADWTAALAEDVDNPHLLQRRAAARERLGRLEDAVADLTRALAGQEEEDVDPELLLARGALRARQGQTEAAREDLQAGLAAMRPGDPPTLGDALRRTLDALP